MNFLQEYYEGVSSGSLIDVGIGKVCAFVQEAQYACGAGVVEYAKQVEEK